MGKKKYKVDAFPAQADGKGAAGLDREQMSSQAPGRNITMPAK
jgi:hypothetical protein